MSDRTSVNTALLQKLDHDESLKTTAVFRIITVYSSTYDLTAFTFLALRHFKKYPKDRCTALQQLSWFSFELPAAMTHSDKHLRGEWLCISFMKWERAAGLRHILNHFTYFSLLQASCTAKLPSSATKHTSLWQALFYFRKEMGKKERKKRSYVMWPTVSLLSGESDQASETECITGLKHHFRSSFLNNDIRHPFFSDNLKMLNAKESCYWKQS